MAYNFSNNVLVAVAFLLVCILCYQYVLYPALFSPLAKIPNAYFLAPYTPLWILWKRLRNQENRTIYKAHKKHGKIIRLGPNEVSINSVSDGLKIVYTGNFDKHKWYPNLFANYGVPNLFTITEGKAHQERKRIEASIYTKSYVQKSEDMQTLSNAIIFDRFLPILQNSAATEAPIEVHEMNSALAMDFTAAYLFGLNAGTDFLRNVSYRKHWLALYDSTKAYWATVAELRSPAHILSKFGIHLVPPSVYATFEEVGAWCLSMCAAASVVQGSEADGSRAVVYERMLNGLEKQEVKASSGYPRDLEVASEMLDHIFAGHETVAVTLTYLMYELSRTPDLQTELRAELATLDPQLAYLSAQSLPSCRALDALPLLDAIINETLRRWPVVPGPQPRITPRDSKPIGGYSGIPSGVRISASAYSLHRNEEVFPEPETFRPKRWLVEKGEREEMFRWFFTFGTGARMCLGTHFAYQVMKLIVAAIYTNYATRIVEMGDMTDADGFVGRPLGNKLVLGFKQV